MTTAPRPMAKTAALTPADLTPPLSPALLSPALANPRIPLPAGVKPFQLNWPYIIVIGAYHVVAVLAFMPGYFSWSGLLALAIVGTHLCGLFGINLCYHRLLTHRGLKCPKWLEHSDGRDRDVLPAGNPGPLGRDPSPAPSVRRRTAGPA